MSKRKIFTITDGLEILLKKIATVSEVSESTVINFALYTLAQKINGSFTDKDYVKLTKSLKEFSRYSDKRNK